MPDTPKLVSIGYLLSQQAHQPSWRRSRPNAAADLKTIQGENERSDRHDHDHIGCRWCPLGGDAIAAVTVVGVFGGIGGVIVSSISARMWRDGPKRAEDS